MNISCDNGRWRRLMSEMYWGRVPDNRAISRPVKPIELIMFA